MILLHVHSLKSGYGSKPVCGPVSFTLQKKQLISIEGSNGSGKSTLLKTLLGDLKPISGNYSWTETTRKKIAYLPQITNHELNSSLSVSEILAIYEVSDKLRKFVGHPNKYWKFRQVFWTCSRCWCLSIKRFGRPNHNVLQLALLNMLTQHSPKPLD